MSTAANPGELVARCFAARTAAHIAHLRTRSYSAHMALNEFYDAIVELADAFAETYQGHFGPIDDFPNLTPPDIHTDSVKTIRELSEWATKNRNSLANGRTDLGNIIDEVTAQCGRSLYKLTMLK
jgi:hypothetical protein